ncbi:MAG: DMT family transporter [Betaproteobacteria bacterium]
MTPRSVALLVILAALWGGSFVFMRVAVPALGPIPLAFARVTLAATVLLALAVAQRRMPNLRSRWREFAVVGIVNSALPFVLFCYAEQYITASAAAILNATSPFFGAIAAAIWLREALTWRKLAGMTLGFAGVAVLVGWQPEDMTREIALAFGACLAASLCYGLGGTFTKRHLSGVPVFSIACGSQLAAAITLAPAVPFASIPGPVTALVAANVLALAIASTAVAYLIYFKLIADAGPARALTVTFLIPLFGVLWGFLFLGEALTPNMLAGGALIVAGTALAIKS